MNTTKKLVVLLLAVVLVLAFSVTALADVTTIPNNDTASHGGNGSITINDAEAGQSYTVYRVFDAVIDEGAIDATTGVAPATYYVSKSSNIYTWITADAQKSYFTVTDDPTDLTRASVAPNTGSIIDALNQSTFKPDTLGLTGYKITLGSGAGDQVIFKNIPYGYYYMSVTDPVTSATGISVSKAIPNAVMNLKINRGPGNIDKVVDEKSVQIGQVLTYQSSFRATNFSEAMGSDITNTDKSELITRYYLLDTPDEDALCLVPVSFRVFPASALQTAGTDGGGNAISNIGTDGKIKHLAADVVDGEGNPIYNEDGVALKAGMEDLYQKNADGSIKTYASAYEVEALRGKAVYVTNTRVLVSDNGLYTAPTTNNGYYVDPTNKNVTILPWTKQATTDVNGDGTVNEDDLISLYPSPSYVVCTYEQTVGTGIMSQDFNGFEYVDKVTGNVIYTQPKDSCTIPTAMDATTLLQALNAKADATDDQKAAAEDNHFEAKGVYDATGFFTGYQYLAKGDGTLADGTLLYEDHNEQQPLTKTQLYQAVDALNLNNEATILQHITDGHYEARKLETLDGKFINTFDAYWDLESTPDTTELKDKPHVGPVSVTSCSTGISLRKLVAGSNDFDILDDALFTLAKVTEYDTSNKPKSYVYYTGDKTALAEVAAAEAAYNNAIIGNYETPAAAAAAVMAAQGALDTLYAALWSDDSSKAAHIKADNMYETMEFLGLRKGEYKLSEVKPPIGYGLAPDTFLKITHNDNADASALTHYTVQYRTAASEYTSGNTISVNSNGFFTVRIYDTATQSMPETGGIGTTIFRVVGSILVLGAAVVLVAKRRAAKNA